MSTESVTFFGFFNIFNFIVRGEGSEVSVARIHFLSVSLANFSLFLNTFYDCIIFDSIIFVNCIESI